MVERRFAIHWAWLILGICFVNLFVNYSVRLGYGVLLPEMIRDLDFSRAAAGTIYNAYLFTYIAIAPLTGYLTDRLGARRVISVCLLVLGVAVVLMGTAKTLWSASLFFGLAGLRGHLYGVCVFFFLATSPFYIKPDSYYMRNIDLFRPELALKGPETG